MKAIIESALNLPVIQSSSKVIELDKEKAFDLLQSYNSIISIITISDDKEMLKTLLKSVFAQDQAGRFFIYGFGGSHMWVKQIDDNERVIFVEFE